MTRSILHVAQPRDAGVPAVAGRLVADQAARGWRVSVACPGDSELRAAAEAAGARWLGWEADRSPGPSVPGEAVRLARAVAAASPDLVHLHSAKAGLAGRLALRGRLPTVFQPHAWSFQAADGLLRTLSLGWERLGARWADVILCVSADERTCGEQAGVRARYAVVANGVEIGRHRAAGAAERAAARRSLGLGDGPLVVAVGRLSRQKGQDVLLEAWPEVARRVPEAQLALVGDGPDRDLLETRAPGEVRFAGWHGDVSPWLEAASVIAVPSRWEGFPLILLEAMATARSVVAADVAGASEALAGGCGEIVAIDDPGALARALAARLADPVSADREGERGRRRVEAAYDVRTANRGTIEVYDDVLARFGRGRH